MLRKYSVFILFLLCIILLKAQHPFAGGDGSKNSPFQLTNAIHLDSLRNYCGDSTLHFRLMNDIDLTNHLNTYYGTDGWQPVDGGNNPINNGHFQGKLYGGGHKITGFRIGRIYHQSGFFSYLNEGAYIDSLGIVVAQGDSVYSGVRTGILAGMCEGATITNCYAVGKVSGGAWTGGLVGSFFKGTMISCHSNVEVIGSYNCVGGLVGLLDNSVLINSYSEGTVTAESYTAVGGLIGSSTYSNISYCYSNADVKGSLEVGGLVGSNLGNITSSYARGNVTGNDKVGGLVGEQDVSVTIYNITDCYSIGNVTGNTQKVGGFMGYNPVANLSVVSCYYDTLTSSQSMGIGEDLGNVSGAIQGRPTPEMMQQATYTNWNFNTVWKIVEGCTYPLLQWQPDPNVAACKCSYNGSGTQTDPYQITDALELDCLRNYCGVAYKDLHFAITKNIDLKSYIDTVYPISGWLPIGSNGITRIDTFCAKLHGGNHIISNLWIDNDTMTYVGLFAELNPDGIIDNVVLENVNIKGYRMVGGISGANLGIIERCYVSGYVEGSLETGGICGWNGYSVKYCTNESYIKGGVQIAGGIAGYNYLGLKGGIHYCSNLGKVEGAAYVGGIVGVNWGYPADLYTYACYNLGNVIGDSIVGGIVGYNMGKISCCYNVGSVVSSKIVGAIAGWSQDFSLFKCPIIFCYFDKETSGLTDGIGRDDNNQSANIEIRTNADMQQIMSFPNSCWSYNGNTWEISKSCVYPYFEPQTELTDNCAELAIKLSYVANDACGINGAGNKTVVINEIMAYPDQFNSSIVGCPQNFDTTQDCNGEWIELYNPSKYYSVDISCWYLGSAASEGGTTVYSQGFIFPQGSIVPPRGYVVVRGEKAPAIPSNLLIANGGNVLEVVADQSSDVCYGGGSRFWLPNQGSWMAVYDSRGVPRDAVMWGDPWYDADDSVACNPNPRGPCGFSGVLRSFTNIPDTRKTIISSTLSTKGKSYSRKIDGEDWDYNNPVNPTYGTNNGTISTAKTCNGKAIVTITGGVAPYMIDWDDPHGQTADTAIDLCGRRYCVTVRDAIDEILTECVDVPNIELLLMVDDTSKNYCVGDTISFNATSTGGSAPRTYLWEGPGNYTSNVPNLEIVNSDMIHSGKYYITVSDTNNCSKTDSVTVKVDNSIKLQILGQASSYCEGDNIQLFLSNQTNISNIQWLLPDGTTIVSDTLTIQNCKITNAGQYIVNAVGNCGVVPDTVNVTIGSMPIVNLGSDITVCDSVQLTAPNGAYQYLWSTGAATQSITVNTTGDYWVTVTENGCSATDTINVAVDTLVILEIVSSLSYCEGDDIKLFLKNQAGVSNILWSFPDGSKIFADTLTIQNSTNADAGQYIVDATRNCGTKPDTINIAVNPMPIVNLGADTTVCNNMQLTAPNGTYQYLWSTGATTQAITVNTTGEYWVMATDNGCSAIDTINVVVDTTIKLEIVGQSSYCEGDDIKLFLKDRTNLSNIQWLLPDKNTIALDTFFIQNSTYNNAGLYIVDAVANCGVIPDTLNVWVNSTPWVNLGPDISVCGEARLFVNTHLHQQLWSTGETTSSITVNTTGDYWVIGTENNCSATDTIHVEIHDIPSARITQNNSLCENQTAELSVNTTASSILWSTGETSSQIEIAQPGIYWVETNNAMCTNRDTIEVKLTSTPTLQLAKDGDLCTGSTTVIKATTNAQSILWNTGETTPEIQISTPGEYWVEAGNAGCVIRDTIEIDTATGPQLQILQDGNLCHNVTLTAQTDAPNVLWSTGETTSEIQVSDPGQYWVEASNADCVTRDTIEVNTSAGPQLQILQEGNLCHDAEVILKAETNAPNILWSTGETTPQITVNKAGTYTVIVTDQNNCESKKQVSIGKRIPTLQIEQTGDLCQNGAQYLTAVTNAEQVLWNTGQTDEAIMITTSGKYTVTASTGSCRISETIEIYCGCELKFPNAFNPDGVLSTTFGPAENSQIVSFKMHIYDRWGKKLFETNSMENRWNGKVEGKMVQHGAYVYVAYYLCEGETVLKEKRGTILVVR